MSQYQAGHIRGGRGGVLFVVVGQVAKKATLIDFQVLGADKAIDVLVSALTRAANRSKN